jgi:hypothetical protein
MYEAQYSVAYLKIYSSAHVTETKVNARNEYEISEKF